MSSCSLTEIAKSQYEFDPAEYSTGIVEFSICMLCLVCQRKGPRWNSSCTQLCSKLKPQFIWFLLSMVLIFEPYTSFLENLNCTWKFQNHLYLNSRRALSKKPDTKWWNIPWNFHRDKFAELSVEFPEKVPQRQKPWNFLWKFLRKFHRH